MAKQVVKTPEKQVRKQVISAPRVTAPRVTPFLFGRRNFMVLFIGLSILALGFLMMAGGSQSPNQFDESVVYSFRRITLSTLFVVAGFIVVLYSIFLKHSPDQVRIATEQ